MSGALCRSHGSLLDRRSLVRLRGEPRVLALGGSDRSWRYQEGRSVVTTVTLFAPKMYYTLGPPLRILHIKNMGMDLAPERLRICP